MPKISVIIPVYNGSKYLVRCVKSVLNNTFKDYEILLINDGSTDNSLEICKNLAAEDSRILVLDKSNEGVAKTRNLGIQKAKGKYVMFIDNDDFVDSDYLETHYQLIVRDNAKVAITGFKRTNTKGKEVRREVVKKSHWTRYLYVSPWAKIFEREYLLNNDIWFFDYLIGEDVIFNLRLHSLNPKCVFLDYVGYDWFLNDKSVSNTVQKGFNPEIDLTVFLNKAVSTWNIDKYLIYYLKRYIVWYLLYSGKTASLSEFVKQFNFLYSWYENQDFVEIIKPFSSELRYEKKSISCAVKLFDILRQHHSEKLFARIYCKGSNVE